MNSSFDLEKIAQQAQQASHTLISMGALGRNGLLHQFSDLIEKRQDDILEANTLDLEASREMAVPDIMLDWLRLTPERIQEIAQLLEALAQSSDPLEHVGASIYHSHGAQTYCQRIPLGVIGLIYESLPQLGAIAAGLCIRSGNALILKGGAEASHSNRMITEIFRDATESITPDLHAVQLLPTAQSEITRELLALKTQLQLLIPYGRPSLIQQVIKQASVPVLKTAIGNSYLYCSPDASAQRAIEMIIDSHQGEPDAVNAIDKVIFHQGCSTAFMTAIIQQLDAHKYTLKASETLALQFPHLSLAHPQEWSKPFLDSTILLRQVQSIDEAIQWINTYSSGHANCIATSSYQDSHHFTRNIISSMVYVNASPRFERHPQGQAIALGIARLDRGWGGPILAESLTCQKQVLQG